MDRKPASHLGHVVRIVEKPLDQCDIRFPASHSFISYLMACEAVQICASRHSYFPKDTRHFPIREWLCLAADFSTRRILSCVLQEQKAPILRGYFGIVGFYLQIQKDPRLFGGPGRDRTDDLFHAMEARSQLRHRPTEKLPLVYTSLAHRRDGRNQPRSSGKGLF